MKFRKSTVWSACSIASTSSKRFGGKKTRDKSMDIIWGNIMTCRNGLFEMRGPGVVGRR